MEFKYLNEKCMCKSEKYSKIVMTMSSLNAINCEYFWKCQKLLNYPGNLHNLHENLQRKCKL